MVFGLWFFLLDMSRGTVAIYDLFMFMTLIPIIQPQYSGLSHHVSFIKIVGIIALCMSLNLIKCSSHLKENIKIQNHFTNNSSIFCYSTLL